MRRAVVLWWLVVAVAAWGRPAPELYAVCYAQSTFPESYVIEGGPHRRIPFAFYSFLLRLPGHTVLIDTGYLDPSFGTRFAIHDYHPLAELLQELGVKPQDVTDVVITHAHWDHVDGLSAFPQARVYMARRELQAIQGAVRSDKPWSDGYWFADRTMLEHRRLDLVDGDSEVLPGLRLLVAGGHTPGMLAVVINGKVVLVGDNAYLYRNLQQNISISSAARADGAPDAMPWIRAQVGPRAELIPGHDPELLHRFPLVAPHIVRIL